MAILPPDKNQERLEATLAAKRTQAEEQAALEVIQRQTIEAAASLSEMLEKKKLLEEELILDEELGHRIKTLRETYEQFMKLTESAQEAYVQLSRDLDLKRHGIGLATTELSKLEARVTTAKSVLGQLVNRTSELEPKPVELEKKIGELVQERDELEKFISRRRETIQDEESALEDKRRTLADINTTLRVYDNRLRSEYGRMFPNTPYKSPFKEKEE